VSQLNCGAHEDDDPLLLLLPEVVLPEPLLLPLELLLELRPRMRPFFSCISRPSSACSAGRNRSPCVLWIAGLSCFHTVDFLAKCHHEFSLRTGVGDRLRRGGVGDRPRERPPLLPCGGGELRLLRSALRRLGGGGDLIGITHKHINGPQYSAGRFVGRLFGNPSQPILGVLHHSVSRIEGQLQREGSFARQHHPPVCTCAAGCSAASWGWATGGACPCPCPQGAAHHGCERPGYDRPACKGSLLVQLT
jgi:hypothetical protein